MKKTTKTYQTTLAKITNEISTSGSYIVCNEKGKSREMDAALTILDDNTNLFTGQWLDNRTIQITEMK
jgi:hypothetical protein